MAELNRFNINDAGLDDGSIDFYTLLQEPLDADTETLRAKIGALYNEAQSNRDHRNLTRRREYQTLLELLPRARIALLDPEKRGLYDAYMIQARLGAADPDFDAFMNELSGQNEGMGEKTALLGIQDKEKGPRARVINKPADAPKTPIRPRASVSSSPPKSSPAPIGAIGGFVVGAIIGYLIFHQIIPTILLGVLVACVGFAVLNKKPSGRIRS